MKHLKNLSAIIIITSLFAACQKDAKQIPQQEEFVAGRPTDINNVVGHVYTLSNQTGGNEVIEFERSSTGILSWSGSYSTGGTGTGGGLGNQGALVLTDNGNFLLAINAGSNSIASFKAGNSGLSHVMTIASGGMMPVSITQYGNLVYVLNAGGSGNISGFMIDGDGNLSPIIGSTKPLSSSMAGAAQVSFVQDGKVLVVSEKATNKLITYTVNSMGVPGTMHSMMSAHPTPFGFAVGHNSNVYVTEADGGNPGTSAVSSYHVDADGSISLNMGPVTASQTAACWAVATNSGKYVYATNTGDNNVSSFVTDASGGLEVWDAVAGNTEGGPIDAALSNNSKYLYVLNAGGHSISAFGVGSNGSLDGIQTVHDIPIGATGLIAK